MNPEGPSPDGPEWRPLFRVASSIVNSIPLNIPGLSGDRPSGWNAVCLILQRLEIIAALIAPPPTTHPYEDPA